MLYLKNNNNNITYTLLVLVKDERQNGKDFASITRAAATVHMDKNKAISRARNTWHKEKD